MESASYLQDMKWWCTFSTM